MRVSKRIDSLTGRNWACIYLQFKTDSFMAGRAGGPATASVLLLVELLAVRLHVYSSHLHVK